MNPIRPIRPWVIALVVVVILVIAGITWRSVQTPADIFDSTRAYQDVVKQVELGPRPPGSQAHAQVINYISGELEKAGWEVTLQQTERMGHAIYNIIAKRGSGPSWLLLGAHFDTRMISDRDPDPARQQQAVIGANDGASGVAILLELARSLPPDLNREVWLVFFDAEDQGSIPGWDWILGSRAFVETLQGQPDAVVIVDMIGDVDLNIYKERNSDPGLTDEIWAVAAQLGYDIFFIPEYKYSILDDHTPFLERGMRAIDIIDFDYPYWHTSEDTLDKVSQKSLEIVGKTLHFWITSP